MRTTISRFAIAVMILYFGGVVFLGMQPLRTFVASGYQGVYFKGGDESQYIMRIRDAMTHPWTDVSNAVTSGEGAPRGLQMTLFETLAGTLLSHAGLSATHIAILLSVLIAPLAGVFLALLASKIGANHRMAFLAGLVFLFLLFGPLRRVVHQSWSLPFVLGTLLLLVRWWREPKRSTTIALGVLLGLVPGIYFWSWTYLWAVFGILTLLTIAERWIQRELKIVRSILFHAFGVACIAVLTALPFFVLMWLNAHHPAADATTIRSSLIHAREFESIPRSLVLLILTLATVLWSARSLDWKRTIPALSFTLALFAVTHQQFVHGLVLSFWTHYYPYVSAVSLLLIAVILSLRHRRLIEYVTVLAACVFLVGAFYDYKGRSSFAAPLNDYQRYQHLSGLITTLQLDTEHQVVLSDPETSLIIGNETIHDLAYTEYLRHVLLSNEELAERYCLTQIQKGSPPDTDWLANNVKELSAAGRAGTEEVFQKDLVITKNACDWVVSHPKDALKKYGITRFAWDERNYPNWRIDQKLFTPLVKGPGWSLWAIR